MKTGTETRDERALKVMYHVCLKGLHGRVIKLSLGKGIITLLVLMLVLM